ncbi:MAG: DUF3341 domain-containing protein [Crocinitomix sp.]|nr:DUF3341 domain-containing protein [Crocinitomix sp.]
MADRVIYAMYDDDMVLLDGAKKLVSEGVHITDVFSPFPIHGIDPVIGVKHTRLGIVSFMFGLLGMALAVIGFKYMMIDNWPMNIGGKPNFTLMQNFPAFVPITFEFTVLFAAHGMAITYLLRNKTLPGMPADNPYPRTTDDRFVMEIRLSDNTKFSASELHAKIKETEIIEIEEKDYVVIK